MGGKGRKRREKNYLAAHGGNKRLPPPPAPRSIDAVPSKLRKLMAYTKSSQPGSANEAANNLQIKGGGGSRGRVKNLHAKDKPDSKTAGDIGKGNDDDPLASQESADDDLTLQNDTHEKRKKTKKRKRVSDLRFENLEEKGSGTKRREHKKKRLEAKKKKHNRGPEENEDFPRHEKVQFGDVVQAPPKLLVVPRGKGLKAPQDASQERLRLMAVQSYRDRRAWASRPGTNLRPPIMDS